MIALLLHPELLPGGISEWKPGKAGVGVGLGIIFEIVENSGLKCSIYTHFEIIKYKTMYKQLLS